MVATTLEPGKQLANMKVGSKGHVSHFTDHCMACKLLSMGILPGTQIEVVRTAPFGGGCYIKADNLLIALRKTEACSIMIR